MSEPARHLDEAHCADLVLGLLDGDARQRALMHASGCTACALRLRAHASTHERALAGVPRRRRGRVFALSMFVALPAAAAVLLVMLLGPATAPRSRSGEIHWLPSPNEGVLWREGEAEDAHLSAGFRAYARHDLVTAARELEAARTRDAAEQARRLYLSHVRLQQGRTADALALLRSLTWSELPVAVQREGVALLARTLRASGATTSADSLELTLATTPEWVPIQP